VTATREAVLAALATVRDPELDEPITALGFVGSCTVAAGGDAEVHLRLPTPQCAPNFAYLMAADARRAIAAAPGVTGARVVLDDHYTGEEINAALARDGDFATAFPGESTPDQGELTALRALFRRKALLARQGRVCRRLQEAGHAPDAIVALTVGDLPAAPDAARALELRAELGLPTHPGSPALVAGDGAALQAGALALWERKARLVALSLESNGAICRALLEVRHGVPDPTAEAATA
jgi:metal-sulfur cluster biosynthetic enzyme